MPRYEGGKNRRHFTLSSKAYEHLSCIARNAMLSKSEALERLIRATPLWEGSALLANDPWKFVTDHTEASQNLLQVTQDPLDNENL